MKEWMKTFGEGVKREKEWERNLEYEYTYKPSWTIVSPMISLKGKHDTNLGLLECWDLFDDQLKLAWQFFDQLNLVSMNLLLAVISYF